ncbi:acetyltransferase (GNAT) family protein [Mesorhizobium sp. J18]|uniref:GNAT family N-acetyltransferase n=1 Tax=Mesorhizobium sp. J18 TaxID=935263 RepID=UPI00119AE231|nr:GNAT family N-acetyltransferase [Mesorhizobium sp. J18]TWG92411.1 acetyltransferase (GNAT) family protein [Mesorhizobium sp. J18]
MLRLRPPLPDEGPALTELCLRSKAVHGYDAAFMEACRGELTVDPARPASRIMVAEMDGVRAGIAEISFAGNEAELDKLFVELACQGKGVGKVLLDWAKSEAIKHGAGALVFDADPGACDFYEKQGAILESRTPSGSIPGRFLPRYRLPLRGGSA